MLLTQIFLLFTPFLSEINGSLLYPFNYFSHEWDLFPFIVSLRENAQHFCTGILISNNAIITAGSCLEDRNNTNFEIKSGNSTEILVENVTFFNDSSSSLALIQINGTQFLDEFDEVPFPKITQYENGTEVVLAEINTERDEITLRKLVTSDVEDGCLEDEDYGCGTYQLRPPLCNNPQYIDPGTPVLDSNFQNLVGLVGLGSERDCLDEYQLFLKLQQFDSWIQEQIREEKGVSTTPFQKPVIPKKQFKVVVKPKAKPVSTFSYVKDVVKNGLKTGWKKVTNFFG